MVMRLVFLLLLLPSLAGAAWWDTAPGGAFSGTADDAGRLPYEESGTGYTLTIGKILERAVQPSDAGTVFLAPTGDGSGLSGVVTSEADPIVGAINGLVKANGAGTISQAVAGTDYFNASSQIDHDQTTNFVAAEHIDWTASSAGTIDPTNYVDNTGLPSAIIIYSDSANFAAFDTACTAGKHALIDVSEGALAAGTVTLECSIEFLSGITWTDGGTNDITFSGKLTGPNETIFSGFTSGEITISGSTDTILAQWFGLTSGSGDDSTALKTWVDSSTGGQNMIAPVGGDYDVTTAVTNAGTGISGDKFFFNGSSFSSGSGNSLFAFTTPQLQNYTGQSITITKDTNTFDMTGLSISVGNTVLLRNNTSWIPGTTYYQGTLGKVVEISGSTAYLDIAPRVSFTATNVEVYDTVESVIFEGAHLDMSAISGANNYIGVNFTGLTNSIMRFNTAIGSDDAAVAFFSGLGNGNIIENNFADHFLNDAGDGIGGRVGYGFATSGGSNVLVRNNKAKDCKHLYIEGGRSVRTSGIVFRDNYGYNDITYADDVSTFGDFLIRAALESHANSLDIVFQNNTIVSPAYLVNYRNDSMELTDNKLFQTACSTCGEEATNYIIYDTEAPPQSLLLAGNTIYSENGAEISSQGALSVTRGHDNKFINITSNSVALERTEAGSKRFDYLGDLDFADFEDGTDQNWTFSDGGGSTSDSRNGVTTDEAKQGAYSVGLFGSNTGGSYFGASLAQTFNINSEKALLTFWVKASEGGTQQLYVSATTDGAGIINENITGTSWKFYSIEISGSASEAITILHPGADYQADGEGFWVDNVQIYPSPQTNNLLVFDGASYQPAISISFDPSTATLSLIDTAPTFFDMDTTSGTATDSGRLNFVRAAASGGPITSGMTLGTMNVRGTYATDTYDTNRTALQIVATENWSSTAAGFKWEFKSRANSVGSVGGTTVRLTIPADGGVQISASSEPTCDATTRFTMIPVAGGASVADTFRMCMKNSSDTYAWTTIAAP